MQPATSITTLSFKCRKCRFQLFFSEDLLPTHTQTSQCSSWYLKTEDMLPWVEVLIDESGWTEGKLYCPKCNSRVGSFDFIHIVQCSCFVDVIPAIWCPKSRVDVATKYFSRPLQGQALDAGNTLDGKGKDFTSVEGGSSKDRGRDNKRKGPSNDGGVCAAGVQDVMLSSLGNPGNIDQRATSIGVSCCSHKYLLNSSVFNEDTITEMKPLPLFHSSESPSTTTVSDSDVCGGCDADPCPNTYSNNNDTYISIRKLQIGLRDIRTEVENICPGGHSDASTYNMNRESRKRRRKPRRRGRGNWQHEADVVTSFKELKKSKIQHSSHIDIEVSAAQLSSREIDGKRENEKELSDSEIPDCYKCSVCLSLLYQPFMTPCQHVFCGLCIRQLNYVSRGRPKCPLCREPIRNVEEEEDLETILQVSFPVNYRKRAKEAKKNRHRKSALPTPQSTAFDSPAVEENYGPDFRLIHHVTVIALAISLLINGLLVNNNGNPIVRINFQRNIALFIFIAIGCMFASLLLLCLVLFAFDFVKIALLLVISYVVVIKLALGLVLD